VRKLDVVIFFSIFFTVYGLINFHIYSIGLLAIPGGSSLHLWYGIVFWFLALSFIVGRFWERTAYSIASSILIWIGSFWLAAMLYLFLLALIIDLVRLVDWIIPFLPTLTDGEKIAIFAGSVALCLVIVVGGFLNARTPRVKRMSLTVDGKMQAGKTVTLAVASDIHLGTIICKTRIERIVRMINELSPDIILLPGDVVDEDLGPVIRQNLGETLRKLRARHGIFAVTGNHEYIGGVEPACAYLTEHGIHMLRDEALTIDGVAGIIGREDISYNRAMRKPRKELGEIMDGLDRSLPLILMDHQPFHLEDAEQHGVDLQLSGHTHHGQLWPLSIITKRVYELSWGYLRKGPTHYYVSCGAGTWGPPVRTGNRPEILYIELQG
jgi:predicted MPP superfamily phosphohydrolase